jgi:hypothetical protein
MRHAHWTYVLLFIGFGLGVGPIIHAIGSSVAFVPMRLWALFGAAAFVERYGAMHLQLYSTTNHIVWHVANGVSGIVFAAVASILFLALDWYAFGVAYLTAYLVFYAPYTARLSLQSVRVTFLGFERSVALAPAATVLAYVIWATVVS